ncbi:MAG TPA: RDD family protein [Acidimicrobiales bacterium]|nr:RDD family protein [Acidimicrobiales bacterium]
MSGAGPAPAPPAEAPAAPSQRLGGALVDGAAFQLAALGLAGLDTTLAAALSTAAYLAYVVGLTVLRGQTLGKMALGTRVVDAGTGALPTLWQASTRTIVPLAGLVVDVALGTAAVGAFWVLVVYGWLLVDDRRRGLHDRAAGTVVMDVERSEAHRRVGAVAVVAALAVTAVLVAVTLDELEDQPLTAPQADGG